ncbi:MAG: hypothetical protein KF784_12565 [Fimbriimonadaceae bacterium]|nr:hypothetical protein [Fimbriimonadaceae bacterium]
MNKSKLFWMIASTVAVVLLLRFVVFAPQSSDKELIRAALAEAVLAGKEGRPGSVVDLMSKEMTVNDSMQVNMSQIARYVREKKPDVEFSNQEPSINGERALITADAKVSFGLPGMALTVKNVEMEFEKETTTRWLIIPGKQWRLKNVRVPSESLDELAGTASGFSGFSGF